MERIGKSLGVSLVEELCEVRRYWHATVVSHGKVLWLESASFKERYEHTVSHPRKVAHVRGRREIECFVRALRAAVVVEDLEMKCVRKIPHREVVEDNPGCLWSPRRSKHACASSTCVWCTPTRRRRRR